MKKNVTILVFSLFLWTSVASAATLVFEPQERTVFVTQALPIMVYIEPVSSSGNTTDVDITLTITNAELTSVRKTVLAPKVSRRESQNVQFIPATVSTPAKRIITEKLTYDGKIKAKKLMLSVHLRALYVGDFTVSGEGDTGNYTIQGDTRTQPQTDGGGADILPSEPATAPTVIPDIPASSIPSATSVPTPTSTGGTGATGVWGANAEEEAGTSTLDILICEEKEEGEENQTNYILWIILWTISLLVMLFIGYIVGTRKQ